MKEKIKLIVLIVIFVVVLILANNLLNNNTQNQEVNEIESNNTTANVQENKSNITTSVISSYNANTASGFYTDIVEEEKTGEVFEVTEETFNKEVLNSKKKILIEFYADWCEPCKTLSPILDEVAKENLDLKVVKINVDENPNLASTFGVSYIPLIVVLEDAQEVNHAVGAISKKEILELVK